MDFHFEKNYDWKRKKYHYHYHGNRYLLYGFSKDKELSDFHFENYLDGWLKEFREYRDVICGDSWDYGFCYYPFIPLKKIIIINIIQKYYAKYFKSCRWFKASQS